MSVPFVLTRSSATSLHRQIYEAWRTGILSGRFRAGDRVPSTRALSATYAVARITVSAAYDQLLAEGYLETRRGAGTFVASDLPERFLHPVRTSAVRGGRWSPRRGTSACAARSTNVAAASG